MRTLTMNEMQVVSGAGVIDMPMVVSVFSTNDMMQALAQAPAPVGMYEAFAMLTYNFYAAAQFGMATLIWGASSVLEWAFGG